MIKPSIKIFPPASPPPDGAWMRLRSGGGGLLPNPRQVSLRVREVPPSQATSHNLLVMQIGQFVDHDLSVVPTLKGTARRSSEGKEENLNSFLLMPP